MSSTIKLPYMYAFFSELYNFNNSCVYHIDNIENKSRYFILLFLYLYNLCICNINKIDSLILIKQTN